MLNYLLVPFLRYLVMLYGSKSSKSPIQVVVEQNTVKWSSTPIAWLAQKGEHQTWMAKVSGSILTGVTFLFFNLELLESRTSDLKGKGLSFNPYFLAGMFCFYVEKPSMSILPLLPISTLFVEIVIELCNILPRFRILTQTYWGKINTPKPL